MLHFQRAVSTVSRPTSFLYYIACFAVVCIIIRVARRPVFNRNVLFSTGMSFFQQDCPFFNRTVLFSTGLSFFGSPVLQFSVLLNRTQNVLLLIARVLLVLFSDIDSKKKKGKKFIILLTFDTLSPLHLT
jgi:hypothetical protein